MAKRDAAGHISAITSNFMVDATKPNGTDFYVFDSELIGFGLRIRRPIKKSQQ